MPVNEGTEGANITPDQPSAPPIVPVTLPPGYAGPVLPTSAGGLHGLARFESERNMMSGLKRGTQQYLDWLMSLKEDPTDFAYNEAIKAARAQAQSEVGLASPKPGEKQRTIKVQNDPNVGPGKQDTSGKPGPFGGPASQPLPPENPFGGPPPLPLPPDEGTGREENRREYDWRKQVEAYEQPVFRGRPVGTDELYQPVGPKDPFLDGFLSERGVVLDKDEKKTALRSGKYVYMGPEYNEKLGVSRDVYMYVDDAQAAGTQVDEAVISKYQSELELEVTGRMDPILVQYWDKAVEMAQRYAMAGEKVSVREIFDVYVRSAIAQKKASGAGAGAAAPEEFDYYRGMMAVLGDISGVGGG